MAALNAGHRAADTDILIRCDDDLEPAADYVEPQIRLHRDYDGVIGTLKNVYPDLPILVCTVTSAMPDSRKVPSSVAEEGRWLYWNGNSSISAEYFDRTGGYDPAYRLYGWEDVDMGKMVHDVGGHIIISLMRLRSSTTQRLPPLQCVPCVPYTRVLPVPSSCVSTAMQRTLPRTRPVSGVSWSRLSLVSPPRRPSRLWETRAIRFCSSCPLRRLKLVALQVEAASYAGIHYPERAQKFSRREKKMSLTQLLTSRSRLPDRRTPTRCLQISRRASKLGRLARRYVPLVKA